MVPFPPPTPTWSQATGGCRILHADSGAFLHWLCVPWPWSGLRPPFVLQTDSNRTRYTQMAIYRWNKGTPKTLLVNEEYPKPVVPGALVWHMQDTQHLKTWGFPAHLYVTKHVFLGLRCYGGYDLPKAYRSPKKGSTEAEMISRLSADFCSVPGWNPWSLVSLWRSIPFPAAMLRLRRAVWRFWWEPSNPKKKQKRIRFPKL